MRIIGGNLSGIRLNPPPNLPVRPTTDLAKEALFNILQNWLIWDETDALDLFSGTGNITFEMASRGAKHVVSVDRHAKCCFFIKEQKIKHQLQQVEVLKADVLKFIPQCKKTFDFIFADPPYDLPQLTQIPDLIFKHQLLNKDGLLVLEHPSTRKIEQGPYFVEQRKYGYSSFSLFQLK